MEKTAKYLSIQKDGR